MKSLRSQKNEIIASLQFFSESLNEIHWGDKLEKIEMRKAQKVYEREARKHIKCFQFVLNR